MTQIPPKIKKLPNLRKKQEGYIKNNSSDTKYIKSTLGGAKMVR